MDLKMIMEQDAREELERDGAACMEVAMERAKKREIEKLMCERDKLKYEIEVEREKNRELQIRVESLLDDLSYLQGYRKAIETVFKGAART